MLGVSLSSQIQLQIAGNVSILDLDRVLFECMVKEIPKMTLDSGFVNAQLVGISNFQKNIDRVNTVLIV